MASSGPGELGSRLRGRREAAPLSQEELAERANLTAKAIGALERGERRRPYPNTVRALCEALELDEEAARELAAAARAPQAERPPPAAGRSPVPAPSSVPTPPTPMLGRTAEVAHVTALLSAPDARLITVTGPGGVGKTRLAWEVARGLEGGGREVVVVELAAVRRVDLLVPTIARAFGLQAGSDDLIGAIAALVAGRHPLLVLDNAEHLRDGAAEVATLVARCPEVVVLTTSRAPLRIRAEQEVPLGPLPVPGPDLDAGSVGAAASVQVFAARARSAVPDFEVTPANAGAVAEICRRLDGLPLALELAAAHLPYLAPAQLLERLDHALGSARLRDLPERQRTMKATLDWSHALLTADEQEVLAALTTFAGGFDLEAAEEVAAAPGRDVLTALEGLVEQSLVVGPDAADPSGPARLRMLEPVRDHAAAALGAAEAAALAERHAARMARLGRDAEGGLRSAELRHWLDRLEVDHANLRAALTTMLARGDLDAAARLGGDTWLYWALRGHAGEGLVWWQRVLDAADRQRLDGPGRARAHTALAGLRLATGDIAGVRAHAAAAIDPARVAGDRRLLAEVLVLAGMGATFTGDLPAAVRLLDELSDLGLTQEDPYARCHVFVVRAQVSLLQGDTGASGAALDEAEGLARTEAGPFSLGTVLNMQTTLALLLGDDDRALDRAGEAVRVAAEVGTTWTLVYTLSALATLAARRGQVEVAAALFASGAATAEASLLAMAFRPDLEAAAAHLEEVRSRLDPDELARCTEWGRSLDVDDVVALLPQISAGSAPA